MKTLTFIFVAFLVMSSNLLAKERRFRPGTVLYKLKEGIQIAASSLVVKAMEKNSQTSVKIQHLSKRVIALKKVKNPEQMVQNLKRSEHIEAVSLDYLVSHSGDIGHENEPQAKYQWHHKNIKTYSSWKYSKGKDIIVGVCDTGVDVRHLDLKDSLILPGKNIVDNSNDIKPSNVHGTAVSGLIVAAINNLGGVGIAPRAKVLPLKVSNRKDGSAYISDLMNCVGEGLDRGAKVINVSYTGANSVWMASAALEAKDRGSLLVMSAGNSSDDTSSWEDEPSFLIVGATDRYNRLSSFSNYGTAVDLVAPGTSVLTTDMTSRRSKDRYRTISGTSFSSPIVAAAAALLYSINPEFTNEEVQQFLLDSADSSVGSEYYFGSGLLNIEKASDLAWQATGQPDPIEDDTDRESDEDDPEDEGSYVVSELDIKVRRLGRRYRASCSGVIKDKSGYPVSNALVNLHCGRSRQSAITSSNGNFKVNSSASNMRISKSVEVQSLEVEGRKVKFETQK